MTRSPLLVVLLALGLAAPLVGCQTPETNSGLHFGDAVRHNSAAQIASNEAPDGTPRDPIALDGPTADNVVENYHENESVYEQKQRTKRAGITRIDETRQ